MDPGTRVCPGEIAESDTLRRDGTIFIQRRRRPRATLVVLLAITSMVIGSGAQIARAESGDPVRLVSWHAEVASDRSVAIVLEVAGGGVPGVPGGLQSRFTGNASVLGYVCVDPATGEDAFGTGSLFGREELEAGSTSTYRREAIPTDQYPTLECHGNAVTLYGEDGSIFELRTRDEIDAAGIPLEFVIPGAPGSELDGDLNGDGVVRVAVLGDSFISGEGEGPYEDCTDVHGLDEVPGDPCRTSIPPEVRAEMDSRNITNRNLCHRGRHSWATVVGSSLGATDENLLFAACSGAVVGDITNQGQYPATPPGVAGGEPQLDTFRRWTEIQPADVVFVSIGGNDVPFQDLIFECYLLRTPCARPTSMSSNQTAWQRQMVSRLPDVARLVRDGLADIREATLTTNPDAEIYYVGYPDPVDPPTNCGSTRPTFPLSQVPELDLSEQRWLREDLLPYFNELLEAAAREAGVHWVDGFPQAFAGHGLCADEPYLNAGVVGDDLPLSGFGPFGNESFHPNREGHAAWSTLVLGHLASDDRLGSGLPDPLSDSIDGAPAETAPPSLTGTTVSGGSAPATVELTPAAIRSATDAFALPAGVPIRLASHSIPTDVWAGVTTAGSTPMTFPVPANWSPGLHWLELRRIDTTPHTILAIVPVFRRVDPGCDATQSPGPDVDGDNLLDPCDGDPTDGPDADADTDGIDNWSDNCVAISNPGQENANGDGAGDACDEEQGANPFAGYRDAITDVAPPETTIDFAPLSFTTETAPVFGFVATEPGSTFECQVDGGSRVGCTSPYRTPRLGSGVHTFDVRATDPSGNVDQTPAIRRFRICGGPLGRLAVSLYRAIAPVNPDLASVAATALCDLSDRLASPRA